ncbi:DUF397 domain-containing protein [Sinosporangium siamense]|uniref:DUF397 domain-containing protein n=1 Tax=Sinosporangium siamense TaxID=1367973 RepID=A0A919RG71_9ACTN|nr:DUF397 domain-containing protein [Sinosporangium siamense]GII91346.1 DUF397 domain-containing protein [Sinosporangium siamense]
MGDQELAAATWRKSRSSAGNGNCVEVACLGDGGRAVRDSKSPDRPKLVFTAGEWAALVAGVKDGEFD